jgi:hypothetical protein
VAIAAEPLRRVKFELSCSDCGYAVSVRVPPEACPMCRGTVWDHRPWRPFSLLVEDVLHAPDARDEAERRL